MAPAPAWLNHQGTQVGQVVDSQGVHGRPALLAHALRDGLLYCVRAVLTDDEYRLVVDAHGTGSPYLLGLLEQNMEDRPGDRRVDSGVSSRGIGQPRQDAALMQVQLVQGAIE